MNAGRGRSAISRRQFLTRVGTAGAAGAATLGPTLLHATNKSGSKMVLGSGAHTYDW